MIQGSSPKDIFSTHEAARICRVTPMTVIRWIKEGKIPAFRTAGGHRRILVDDLARFCAARGIPFAAEHGEAGRILIADADPVVREVVADAIHTVDARFAVEQAGDAFTAGRLLANFRPALFVIDQRLAGIDALDLCGRLTRGTDEPIAVAVLLAVDALPDVERAFKSRGSIGCLAKPPVASAVQRLVRGAFHLAEAASSSTIYVLDKDGRSVRGLRRDLEARLAGSRVFVFDSVVDLLFAVASEPPDTIIIDVGALDMNGVDFIRRLVARASPSTPVTVVALASGRDGPISALLGAGARAVLTKPVGVEDLVASLRGGTVKRSKR